MNILLGLKASLKNLKGKTIKYRIVYYYQDIEERHYVIYVMVVDSEGKLIM